MLYLPWMSAVLTRGALDYLLPRLSMEGKEPKSLVLPFFFNYTSDHRATFSLRHEKHSTLSSLPNYCTLSRLSLEIFFFPPFLLIPRFFLFFLFFFFLFSFFFFFFLLCTRTRHFFPSPVHKFTPPLPVTYGSPVVHDLLSLPLPLPRPLLLSLSLSGVGHSRSITRASEFLSGIPSWISEAPDQITFDRRRRKSALYLRNTCKLYLIGGGEGEKVLLLEGGKYCSLSLSGRQRTKRLSCANFIRFSLLFFYIFSDLTHNCRLNMHTF